MENSKEKKVDLSSVNLKKVGTLALGALLIALILLLCITGSMRSHIQSEYANARQEIGELVYTELYMFCQSFDQVNVPGVDVQDGLIPDMKEYYLAATTLNRALAQGFGEEYMVLSQAHTAALDAAFEAYDAAFRAGRSTEDAQTAMQGCVDMVRSILMERFNDGALRPM